MSEAGQLIYLTDPKLSQVTTMIRLVGEDDFGSFIELSRTPFYPTGGGQACDIGRINGLAGSIEVQRVTLHGTSVRHSGAWTGTLLAGDEVLASIDQKVRQRHARWHTAGELLAAALHELAHEHEMLRANHRVGEAALVIRGSMPAQARETLRQGLQDWMDSALAKAGPVETLITNDKAKVEALCGFFPEYLAGTTQFRIVRVTPTFARPCVGCHVENLSEIGAVTVRGVSGKGAETRVSYTVKEGEGFGSI
jgi:Ser-tRNA(Ala) deacylase AlaX